ncbi:GNAT family N-acetyltransferase [Sphingopyxis sp. MWB1]|uniref:GNAT family N-acetyltransferase n=1 Tax=Sphingopyxis sp. MWB1 TaxID=1537715 RepID=UPI000AF22527|nr:N-acetyltransferase [Sphingopyxis sp. MWB1]
MRIRPATAEDAEAIHRLISAAFAASEHGYQGEADLPAMLAADGDILLSLVAERDAARAGHILFSRMTVEADGAPLTAAGLAPVSVTPDVQGQGIGSALIRAGLDELRAQGIAISFVLGDPAYYMRFGYSPVLAARFASPFSGACFMAMMLDSHAEWPQGGQADYAPAFGRLG